MKKLALIDGHSLANRAFYALPRLTTSEGIVTNAAYGFVTMLFRLIEQERPDYIAVAFDVGKPTFRHMEFKEYKANRTPTPDDLRSQIPIIKEILGAFKIPFYEVEGYEADDVIGTICKAAEEKGLSVLVVTGDRDALQLVSDKTSAMITRRGISDIVLYDRSEVEKQLGISPEQVPDLKGLMGDASDNIPGIRGVGEKTAMKLLKEYSTVENILIHSGEIKEKRIKELLLNHGTQALFSKELATIKKDVPLEADIDLCKWLGPDISRVKEVFERLEFKSLLKRVIERWESDRLVESPKEEDLVVHPERDEEKLLPWDDLSGFFDEAAAGRVSLAMAMKGSNDVSTYLAMVAKSGKSCVAEIPSCNHEEPQDEVCRAKPGSAKGLLEDRRVKKWGHDLKSIIVNLRHAGIFMQNADFDLLISAYLLDSTRNSYRLEDLAKEHLGPKHAEDLDKSLVSRAKVVVLLEKVLSHELRQKGLWELFSRVEMPLIEVLADMEWNGIKVDMAKARAMSKEYETRLDNIAEEIYLMAGEEFNINSPKQLGAILFEKLGLPSKKKTKTGYSTDSEVLEALADLHEIAGCVLEYRHLAKLKGTYLDGIERLVTKDGKIHTTFNQTVTATGRISSTDPNLQNIPIKMEYGRRIREVFVPSCPDWLFIGADYSQIELRVLAHISSDRNLIEAFKNEEDIHRHTAAEVFGVSFSEVTSLMRSMAKGVNFGIVYGISDFGLAKNIGVSRTQAKKFIDNYFLRYPGVKRYMEETKRLSRQQGFVCTLLNRRRYLPDINSPNRNLRSMSERAAINSPIQGSAADIIKLAMIRVDYEIKAKGLRARMLLQVHDELIFEAPPEEIGILTRIIRECMEGALPLSVPLKVDIVKGSNWYDMK